MATAKISKTGTKVILRLGFEEAAALEALLARVGDETGVAIHDATMSAWCELFSMKQILGPQGLWPDTFLSFRQREASLVEPGEPTPAPGDDGDEDWY